MSSLIDGASLEQLHLAAIFQNFLDRAMIATKNRFCDMGWKVSAKKKIYETGFVFGKRARWVELKKRMPEISYSDISSFVALNMKYEL